MQVGVKWALPAGDTRSCLSVGLFPDFPFMDGYQQVTTVHLSNIFNHILLLYIQPHVIQF